MINLHSMQPTYRDLPELVWSHPDNLTIYAAMEPFAEHVNDFYEVDNSIMSLLSLASMLNREQAARSLIFYGAKVNPEVQIEERTPLHHAVRRRAPNIVYLLLEHKADVNAPDQLNHNTPLHDSALLPRDTIIIKMLLRNGADINRRNRLNQKPIDLARERQLQDPLAVLEAEHRWRGKDNLRTLWIAMTATRRPVKLPVDTPTNTCTAIIPYTPARSLLTPMIATPSTALPSVVSARALQIIAANNESKGRCCIVS